VLEGVVKQYYLGALVLFKQIFDAVYTLLIYCNGYFGEFVF
jgi:hypothetical protein